MGINTATVQKLYIAFFNRPGDTLGQAFWESKMDAGMTESQVAAQFSQSTEYTSMFTGKSTAQIIEMFYTNLFGRDATATEINFWGLRLLNGQETTASIAQTLADSAQGSDATALNNKVTAATSFTNSLTTAAQITGYSGAAANAIASAWLATITNDATTLTAAQTSLSATVTSAMNAGNAALGSTYTLTSGLDGVTGTQYNDTINGTDSTFTALDTIDGGLGTNSLNLNDLTGDKLDVSVAGSVKNVANLTLTSVKGLGGAAANVSGWTGLTSATFNLNNVATAQTITAAGTTATTVTAKVTTASDITVNGGSTDKVTVTNSVDNHGKTITVNGSAGNTTSVTVVETGTAGQTAKVAIADPNQGTKTASTIATVTIDGATSGTQATVASDALTSLTVNNSTDGVAVTAAAATRTLGLTLNNDTAGTIADAQATTLNITTSGKASSGLTINAAAATAVTVNAGVNLSATLGIAAAKTVTLSGAGNITTDLSGINGGTGGTVTASATSGTNTLTLNASEAYTGGTGTSVITETADITAAVAGGSGTADELILNFNLAGLSKTAGNVSGFEVLGFNTTSQGTIDLSKFSGVTGLEVKGAGAALVLNNAAAGTALTLSAAPGQNVQYVLAKDTTADTLSLTLGTSATAGLDFSGKTVDIGAIETVKIVSNGTAANTLALTDAAATSLVLSGAASLTLKGGLAGNTVNSIDATGMAKGTTVDLATNVIGLSTGGVTVTTGAAAIKFTDGGLAAGKVDTITGGDGNNVISDTSATTGTVKVTLGNGANTVDAAASTGNNSITVGNGGNTIKVGNGNNTIVSGTGVDTITVGSGLNVVTTGGGADTVKISAAGANGNIYTTITDYTTKGAKIDITGIDNNALVKGANITSQLGGTAVFQDYLNQAAKTAAAAHTVDWFQWNGDTYVVEVVATGNTAFSNGTDSVVKLTGVVDLSTATFGTGLITHG